jgi:hypothetical protein
MWHPGQVIQCLFSSEKSDDYSGALNTVQALFSPALTFQGSVSGVPCELIPRTLSR